MSDDLESERPATTKPMTGLEKTPRSPSIDLDDTAPDPAPFGADPTPAPAVGEPAGKLDDKAIPAKRAPVPARARLVVWAKRLGIGLLALLVAAAVGAALVIRHYEADLPSLRALKSYNPP